ncbi:CPBP family intramembrane glutamic endopeptidase (plasmid) [Paraclostridium ghonii]|uniref:CPBP family intramembrane glutamic endopeptidase n=1 Tax=Paraclostridium ghonii TaxID=29358 RepID=UPI00305AE64F|nr:CPBP family intramembrane metalloprotease [Paeniclostridium ghonii]
MKKIYILELSDLGIKKINTKEVLIFIMFLALLYTYLFSKEKSISVIINLSIQTVGVAITEEFWARGILCYIIEKISDKKWIVIIINSLIFAFITHMNRPFLDNLVFRLPGSFCMTFVYMRSKKLHHSVLVHFIYNMIGSF